MKKNSSIQYNLITWLTIPLSIFTFMIFIYIYSFIKTKVNNFYDNRLYAIAQSFEQNIGIVNNKIIVDIPNFSIDFLSSNEKGHVYYSVLNDQKELLLGYEELFDEKKLNKKTKIFYTKLYDDVNLRVVSYKSSINSAGKVYNAFITVGETTEERSENINQALHLLFIIMAIVIILSITITLIAVKQGLKPLYELKNIIKKRDKRDLKALNFNAPKEIEDVVNSINILLERSRNTIDYIEQFNSDVSHQLRTPLAEMKVKLELSYKKDDKNFITLNSLLNDMSHITEQLLLYAKTNPNTINLTRFKKISLNKLCKNYSIKVAPRVYSKGFEFAFENLEEEIFINSDSILLESMMDNIINNALHYAVDKNNNAQGTIIVSLNRYNNTVWLSIKDEGYGVKKEDLKSIFERYYRVDSSKKGSGLGLSIVKQIASLHQAKVIASNDKGLKISIIFDNNIN